MKMKSTTPFYNGIDLESNMRVFGEVLRGERSMEIYREIASGNRSYEVGGKERFEAPKALMNMLANRPARTEGDLGMNFNTLTGMGEMLEQYRGQYEILSDYMADHPGDGAFQEKYDEMVEELAGACALACRVRPDLSGYKDHAGDPMIDYYGGYEQACKDDPSFIRYDVLDAGGNVAGSVTLDELAIYNPDQADAGKPLWKRIQEQVPQAADVMDRHVQDFKEKLECNDLDGIYEEYAKTFVSEGERNMPDRIMTVYALQDTLDAFSNLELSGISRYVRWAEAEAGLTGFRETENAAVLAVRQSVEDCLPADVLAYYDDIGKAHSSQLCSVNAEMLRVVTQGPDREVVDSRIAGYFDSGRDAVRSAILETGRNRKEAKASPFLSDEVRHLMAASELLESSKEEKEAEGPDPV